jgi:hypothetical protein
MKKRKNPRKQKLNLEVKQIYLQLRYGWCSLSHPFQHKFWKEALGVIWSRKREAKGKKVEAAGANASGSILSPISIVTNLGFPLLLITHYLPLTAESCSFGCLFSDS